MYYCDVFRFLNLEDIWDNYYPCKVLIWPCLIGNEYLTLCLSWAELLGVQLPYRDHLHLCNLLGGNHWASFLKKNPVPPFAATPQRSYEILPIEDFHKRKGNWNECISCYDTIRSISTPWMTYYFSFSVFPHSYKQQESSCSFTDMWTYSQFSFQFKPTTHFKLNNYVSRSIISSYFHIMLK